MPDSLAVHKAVEARVLVEARGCHLLVLPAYSPDCNPIEPTCAKLKEALRRARARATEALHTAVAATLDAITTADARGGFAAYSYPPMEGAQPPRYRSMSLAPGRG